MSERHRLARERLTYPAVVAIIIRNQIDLRMHRPSNVHRAVAQLAFMATLAACGGEVRESASDVAAADTINSGDLDATSEPSDTAASREPLMEVEPRVDVITPAGWGPLRIGMTQAEAVAAAGEDANPGAVGGPDPDRCDEFRPRMAPPGILVMMERGVLTRISVSRNVDIRTPEGFSVGDSGSEVLDAYGSRAAVDRHQYWAPPAKYITIWGGADSDGERRGMRYEIGSNDEVVHIRAGTPSIEYIEGCV